MLGACAPLRPLGLGALAKAGGGDLALPVMIGGQGAGIDGVGGMKFPFEPPANGACGTNRPYPSANTSGEVPGDNVSSGMNDEMDGTECCS